MPIVCPQCNKDDMIQKVKAVYSGGVSSGQYSGSNVGVAISTNDGTPSVIGGTTGGAGTSQTLLSRRLSPPPEPNLMNDLRPTIQIILVLSLVVFCIIAWNTGAIFSMGPGIHYGWTLSYISLIVAGFFLYSAYKAQKPKFEANRVRWQNWLKIWNNLYYCGRDDCVFDPDSGKSVPADNMSELLKKTVR